MSQNNESLSLAETSKKLKFTWNTQRVILLVVIAMWVFLSIATENFLTLSNIQNVLRQVTIQGINAVGVTLVIITAGIDLSIGSVVALINILLLCSWLKDFLYG